MLPAGPKPSRSRSRVTSVPTATPARLTVTTSGEPAVAVSPEVETPTTCVSGLKKVWSEVWRLKNESVSVRPVGRADHGCAGVRVEQGRLESVGRPDPVGAELGIDREAQGGGIGRDGERLRQLAEDIRVLRQHSLIIRDRNRTPLRPAKLRIGGVGDGEVAVNDVVDGPNHPAARAAGHSGKYGAIGRARCSCCTIGDDATGDFGQRRTSHRVDDLHVQPRGVGGRRVRGRGSSGRWDTGLDRDHPLETEGSRDSTIGEHRRPGDDADMRHITRNLRIDAKQVSDFVQ